jgi:Leucine-rich repeat (LRR) protein
VVWKMGLRIMSLNVSYNKIEELPEQIGELILLKVCTVIHFLK